MRLFNNFSGSSAPPNYLPNICEGVVPAPPTLNVISQSELFPNLAPLYAPRWSSQIPQTYLPSNRKLIFLVCRSGNFQLQRRFFFSWWSERGTDFSPASTETWLGSRTWISFGSYEALSNGIAYLWNKYWGYLSSQSGDSVRTRHQQDGSLQIGHFWVRW